ncbi:predicted protein [Aspergillus terreus NIH2624]|uniref:Nephrocystin 3-like N-terminal domain-containing protein n=1 Tax=Aspergillus terreus (strain NIH 2624 / FGSC A1156) TaxID=341663 RepID=Q0C8N5_ASPTN|nr:uncharacterized protein ATEG_09949 [Aspergillus terreus NIH2624]EAU30140.1 predicted protein [Aspergillus terreus NIH2624]
MLLCGIIDELEATIDNSTLWSFFFCQTSDSRINNATAVLRSLVHQLVDQQLSLISHVQESSEAGRQSPYRGNGVRAARVDGGTSQEQNENSSAPLARNTPASEQQTADASIPGTQQSTNWPTTEEGTPGERERGGGPQVYSPTASQEWSETEGTPTSHSTFRPMT